MSEAPRKATLLLREKVIRTDGGVVEIVIWRLPRATADRPHGLKYRLYFGRNGKDLVRYDNETGKGDHRHIEDREMTYQFISVAKLRQDFEADIRRYEDGGKKKD